MDGLQKKITDEVARYDGSLGLMPEDVAAAILAIPEIAEALATAEVLRLPASEVFSGRQLKPRMEVITVNTPRRLGTCPSA